MPDPFLALHLVAPLWADLGGPIHPVSIRDQMLRAQSIVERARDAGLIGPTRPLLVIGAGAAGVTAALVADRLGVPTLLIERGSAPFGRIRSCTTRWIDPAQYDWPHAWHDCGSYPFSHPPLTRARRAELPWRSERAHRIAARWTTRLVRALRRGATSLRLALGWTLAAGATPRLTVGSRPLLSVPLVDAGGTTASVVVGLVIACVGLGTETTQLPSGGPRGPRFWETDDLEKPFVGASRGVPARVLISGAGDGALQDFLRAATSRKSALDLLQQIRNDIASAPVAHAALAHEARQLLSIEEHAARAYAWNDPSRSLADARVHADLHDVHTAAVTRLLAHQPIIDAVDKLFRTDLCEVTLLSRTSYFPQCYALNRFLVLLLAAVAADTKTFAAKIDYGCELAGFVGTSAGIAMPPAGPFRVQIQRVGGTGAAPTTGPYDAVIIRHGIAWPSKLASVGALSISRHALPYRPH